MAPDSASHFAVVGWGGLIGCCVLCACGGRAVYDEQSNPQGPSEAAGVTGCTDVPGAAGDRPLSAAQAIASGDGIVAVGVDDTEVFYSSAPGGYGSTTLQAVSKTGGAPRAVADVQAFTLRIDDSYVYAGGGSYDFYRIDKRTGADVPFGGNDPFDFDIDATSIYAATLGGGIYRHDEAGGNWIMIATGTAPQGLSLRDGWIYWADYSQYQINRMSSMSGDGGVVETLAMTNDFPRTVVADCHNVYYSLGNYGDTIWRMPLDRSAQPQVFAYVGGAIVIDAASLYVQASAGTWRVSLSSGQVTPLGPGPGAQGLVTGAIAVDAEAVYWSTGDAVMRALK